MEAISKGVGEYSDHKVTCFNFLHSPPEKYQKMDRKPNWRKKILTSWSSGSTLESFCFALKNPLTLSFTDTCFYKMLLQLQVKKTKKNCLRARTLVQPGVTPIKPRATQVESETAALGPLESRV